MDQWLTSDDDVRALVARDRLCPVLIRYRGASEGRFTAPAQDVPDLVAMLTATGRYVRDMSVARKESAEEMTSAKKVMREFSTANLL